MAQRIRELRTERGWSSEVLSRRLDISHKAVLNWEQDRADPSLKNLIALAALFEVWPQYLLGQSDQRNEDSPKVSGGRSGRGGASEPAGRESADVASARSSRRAGRAPRSEASPSRPPDA